jgi:DNA-binding NarL/FixJ family response regulator
MSIRILIADDHPLVRQGLKAALAPLPEVEIVAEAATGQAAIREALLHRPDVVVMDLQMPDLNGIDATRELGRAVPSAAVLVLTMFDDDDWVFAAMRAGARGYVLKGAEQQEIARAILAVAAGEAIFGPAVATRVLAYFATPPTTPAPVSGADRPGTRGSGPAGRRPQQPADRRPARPQRQDGCQPHLRDIRQAPGGRPYPGHPAGPRRRPRPPLTSQPARALLRPAEKLPAQGWADLPLCNSGHRGRKPRRTPKGLVRAVATERRRTDAHTSSLMDASEPAGARTRSGERFPCSRADFVGLGGLEPPPSSLSAICREPLC